MISPVGSWPKVQIFSGIPFNLSKWHAKTTQLHQPNHPQDSHSKFLPNSTSLVLAWSRRKHDSGNHPQLLWPRIWICVPAPESTWEIRQAPTTKPRQPSLVTLQGSFTVQDRIYKNSPSEGMSCNQLRCHWTFAYLATLTCWRCQFRSSTPSFHYWFDLGRYPKLAKAPNYTRPDRKSVV